MEQWNRLPFEAMSSSSLDVIKEKLNKNVPMILFRDFALREGLSK